MFKFTIGFVLGVVIMTVIQYRTISRISSLEQDNITLNEWISVDYKTLLRNYKLQLDSAKFYKKLYVECKL